MVICYNQNFFTNNNLCPIVTDRNEQTFSSPISTTNVGIETSSPDTRMHVETYCGNLVIQNDATLTITGNLTMNPAAKIYVRGNGKLVVNGGSIINSAIDVKSSGKLLLLNSGKLEQHRFGYLNVETGATADLNYGEIIIL